MRFCVFSYPNFTKISRNGRISVPKNTSYRSQKIKPKYDPMCFFFLGGLGLRTIQRAKIFCCTFVSFRDQLRTGIRYAGDTQAIRELFQRYANETKRYASDTRAIRERYASASNDGRTIRGRYAGYSRTIQNDTRTIRERDETIRSSYMNCARSFPAMRRTTRRYEKKKEQSRFLFQEPQEVPSFRAGLE